MLPGMCARRSGVGPARLAAVGLLGSLSFRSEVLSCLLWLLVFSFWVRVGLGWLPCPWCGRWWLRCSAVLSWSVPAVRSALMCWRLRLWWPWVLPLVSPSSVPSPRPVPVRGVGRLSAWCVLPVVPVLPSPGWLAGGPLSVPLRVRLAARAASAVRWCAAQSPPSGVDVVDHIEDAYERMVEAELADATSRPPYTTVHRTRPGDIHRGSRRRPRKIYILADLPNPNCLRCLGERVITYGDEKGQPCPACVTQRWAA